MCACACVCACACACVEGGRWSCFLSWCTFGPSWWAWSARDVEAEGGHSAQWLEGAAPLTPGG